MSETSGRERRQADRLGLRTRALLSTHDTQWEVHVLDVSRTGTRIALLDEYSLALGDLVHLTIDTPSLGISSAPLRIEGEVVHLREHIIGLKYNLLGGEQEQALQKLLDCGGEPVA